VDVLWTALQVAAALVVVGLFLAFLASRDKAGFLGALATVPVALVVAAVTRVRKGSGPRSSPEVRIAPPEDRPGDPVVALFFALVEPPRPEGDVWRGSRSDVLREADGRARPGPLRIA
jgi:hypothetical protein